MSPEQQPVRRSPDTEPSSPRSDVNEPAPDAALLDAILRETSSALDVHSLALSDDLPRLKFVAQRHLGEPLTCDPILHELVEIILETHLPRVCQSAVLKSRVSSAVAGALFENPVARGRLERLWTQLLDAK